MGVQRERKVPWSLKMSMKLRNRHHSGAVSKSGMGSTIMAHHWGTFSSPLSHNASSSSSLSKTAKNFTASTKLAAVLEISHSIACT
jgi:hypothetical protein